MCYYKLNSLYMDEMFVRFGLAMGFGVLMVYLVLVLLFRDILQPVTILTALPLSLGGALGALLAYGAALDLSSVIGILMLMSIVTKNSILLVDFIIENRRHGMPRATALIQAGAERARPIIMTTIAMVAGMVPAVLAGGSGAAFRAPMAVAVIGGLLISTALSLIFVPSLTACWTTCATGSPPPRPPDQRHRRRARSGRSGGGATAKRRK